MKLFCAHCGGRWTRGAVYFTASQPPLPIVYCPRCAPAAPARSS